MPQTTVSAQIPIEHWYMINETVKRGECKNISEFIREAIKQKLKETEN